MRVRLPVAITEARACRQCEADLPEGPRPLVQGTSRSRVLVVGQAPGAAAHRSGVAWDDRSGDRLREWLGISPDAFYDPHQVAIMPMGFCYPGTGRSGDLPPRPECAPLWHGRLLRAFKRVELTIVVGRFAVERYLPDEPGTLTEVVERAVDLLPGRAVLPHPSPRNNIWLKRNPWFESTVLPRVRERVESVLSAAG